MALRPETLKREIENALEALSEEMGGELAARIRPILLANVDRKRLEAFVQNDARRVRQYVRQVAEKYQVLSHQVHQLQIDKSNELWEQLLKQMQTWAYRFLVRKGYNASKRTWEYAKECASEAARSLLRAHFPYDTDFEPWARVIVRHACQKFKRSDQKELPTIDDSLDDLEEILRSPQNPTLDGERWKDRQSEISDALFNLLPERRQVVELKYFQGMSAKEIAEKMGESVRAVYSLQFRALHDLRKILNENRDKFNE